MQLTLIYVIRADIDFVAFQKNDNFIIIFWIPDSQRQVHMFSHSPET